MRQLRRAAGCRAFIHTNNPLATACPAHGAGAHPGRPLKREVLRSAGYCGVMHTSKPLADTHPGRPLQRQVHVRPVLPCAVQPDDGVVRQVAVQPDLAGNLVNASYCSMREKGFGQHAWARFVQNAVLNRLVCSLAAAVALRSFVRLPVLRLTSRSAAPKNLTWLPGAAPLRVASCCLRRMHTK